MGKLIRDIKEEEAMRLLKQVLENNILLLNLQKQVLELQIAEDQKKRREQEREWRRRKYDERQKEEAFLRSQFEIWTDYKNLQYFIKAQKFNQRQAK